MRAMLFSLLLVAAAACGNKSKGPETPEGGDTEGHGNEVHHEHDHSAMPAEMTAFHDHLAPLWHSETPDRQATTCNDAGLLLGLAADIQQAPAPEGAAEDWSERVNTLLLAIDHMKEGCQADSPDFEANFTAVHDGFHALMDALPKG